MRGGGAFPSGPGQTLVDLSAFEVCEGLRHASSTIGPLPRLHLRSPKVGLPLGYHAVHVIVGYDGRQIEAQLRTRVMHDWALAVERDPRFVITVLTVDSGVGHPVRARRVVTKEAAARRHTGDVLPDHRTRRSGVVHCRQSMAGCRS